MLSGSWMKPLGFLGHTEEISIKLKKQLQQQTHLQIPQEQIHVSSFQTESLSLKRNLTPVIWAGVFVDLYFAFSKLLQWRTRRTMFSFKQFSKHKQEPYMTEFEQGFETLGRTH